MKWIINYFRECFCKHDWLIDEFEANASTMFGVEASGTRISMICKKCGYHKGYWKGF